MDKSVKPRMEITPLSEGTTEVLLFGEIGGFWGDETEWFVRDLKDIGDKDILLRINSPGGDAFDGIAIMNALKYHPARVTARVEGMAASAASVIVAGASDEVVMSEGAQLMVHDAILMTVGNASDMEHARTQLDKISQDMAGIYARKSGTPLAEWREAMREETWFTAEEAVACGLADRMDTAVDSPGGEPVEAYQRGRVMASFKYSNRGRSPAPALAHRGERGTQRKGAAVAFNSDLARTLGLAEDASEEDIKAAVEKAVTPEDDPDPEDSAEDLPAEEPEKGDPQGETDDPQGGEEEPAGDLGEVIPLDREVYEDLLERAKRGDEAASHDREAAAASLIETEGIKAGRLVGHQRDKWVQAAVEDFDKTKTELLKRAPTAVNLREKGRGGSDADRNDLDAKAYTQKLDAVESRHYKDFY